MSDDRDVELLEDLYSFLLCLRRRMDAKIGGRHLFVGKILTAPICANLTQILKGLFNSRERADFAVGQLWDSIGYVLTSTEADLASLRADASAALDNWITVNGLTEAEPSAITELRAVRIASKRARRARAATNTRQLKGASNFEPDKRANALGPQKVYRFYGVGGILLYVGVTSSVERRMIDHLSQKHWWPQVVKMEWEGFDSRWLAEQREAYLIHFGAPLFNVQHNEGRELRNIG
jgi:hypothetical protein